MINVHDLHKCKDLVIIVSDQLFYCKIILYKTYYTRGSTTILTSMFISAWHLLNKFAYPKSTALTYTSAKLYDNEYTYKYMYILTSSSYIVIMNYKNYLQDNILNKALLDKIVLKHDFYFDNYRLNEQQYNINTRTKYIAKFNMKKLY